MSDELSRGVEWLGSWIGYVWLVRWGEGEDLVFEEWIVLGVLFIPWDCFECLLCIRWGFLGSEVLKWNGGIWRGWMLYVASECNWMEWNGLRGGWVLNWENECCREMGGLNRIVLMLWGYTACFSWVGESALGEGLRMGICIIWLWYFEWKR